MVCRAQSVAAKSLAGATVKSGTSSNAGALANGKGPAVEEGVIDTTPVLESFVPWLSDQVGIAQTYRVHLQKPAEELQSHCSFKPPFRLLVLLSGTKAFCFAPTLENTS